MWWPIISAWLLLFAEGVCSEDIPAHFYPLGTEHNDAIAPPNDDGSTSGIAINHEFPFFDEIYTSVYVNTNGVISFDEPFVEQQPSYIPLGDNTPSSSPLGSNTAVVAPFWGDVDTSKNGGRIYYSQIDSGQLLRRASEDIVEYGPSGFDNFNASWLSIATWRNVTRYRGHKKVNSFQVVLLSDGTHSFCIFNYGDICSSGRRAQVGFNAGDGQHFFTLPDSLTAATGDVATASNVGQPGRWIFRIDTSVTG